MSEYKLEDIDIQFISLVRMPANRRRIIWKSEGGVEVVVPLMKVADEKKVVYGIVYAPGEIDEQGDWTTAEEIEKAAYRFMKNLRLHNIDKNHDFQPKDAFICESWLIRAGDPLFPEEREGAWAVGIKVEDDELWKGIKEGEITGLSMAGVAKRVPMEKGFKKAPEEKEWDFKSSDYTVQQLARASAWVKGMENPHSDPIPRNLRKEDCKLPHHLPDGTLVLRGVMAAAAALQGARRGVDIPSEDIPRVRAHLERHYHEFGRKAPWETKKSIFKKIKELIGGEEMDEERIREIVNKAIEDALSRRDRQREEEEFRKSMEEGLREMRELKDVVEELRKEVEEIKKSGPGRQSGPQDQKDEGVTGIL